MSLSHSIDKAVKAYIDHTNMVLSGDGHLDLAYLTAPFDQMSRHAVMGHQQITQPGLTQTQVVGNGVGTVAGAPAEAPAKVKRAKRPYKARDPKAPKRPLTAYFRYLQEQRGPLGEQMKAQNDGVASRPGDLSKEATERWNALSKADQQPYRDAYQAALKEYGKLVVVYKAEAENPEQAAAPVAEAEVPGADADAEDVDDHEEDEAVVDSKPPAVAETEEEDDSDDDSSSSDEEVIAPPPAPKEKTPKSAMKKAKQSIPPTPLASNIDPVLAAPTPGPATSSSSSPQLKRKAPALNSSDTAEAETGAKKKRGRPSKADKAAAEQAPATPATEEPAKKKKKKKADA